YAARIFDYKFKNNLLIYIGKNSLIILALHMISFKLVDLIQITVYNLDYSQMSQRMINGDSFWWVIYTLFGVFVPLGIAAIFNPGYDFFKKSVLMKGESVN
ncbi:MAG TPA: hypothetical protein VHP30_08385, partial [Ignavibacteriales bacterium]|nr:hypothetical protein [Ignavibacteriales bacterium]